MVWHVREVPRGDSCTAANGRLFDHLIGARQKCWRHGEAEYPSGLGVDNQLELVQSVFLATADYASIISPRLTSRGLFECLKTCNRNQIRKQELSRRTAGCV